MNDFGSLLLRLTFMRLHETKTECTLGYRVANVFYSSRVYGADALRVINLFSSLNGFKVRPNSAVKIL